MAGVIKHVIKMNLAHMMEVIVTNVDLDVRTNGAEMVRVINIVTLNPVNGTEVIVLQVILCQNLPSQRAVLRDVGPVILETDTVMRPVTMKHVNSTLVIVIEKMVGHYMVGDSVPKDALDGRGAMASVIWHATKVIGVISTMEIVPVCVLLDVRKAKLEMGTVIKPVTISIVNSTMAIVKHRRQI